jgi:outer membrane protein assembly factor BamA
VLAQILLLLMLCGQPQGVAAAVASGATSAFARTDQADQTRPAETIAEIRVHGNVATPDDEIRRLAGIDVGAPFTADTLAQVTARLKNAHRFESVDVLKRYASITDPSKVLLVVIVDEGRVKIEGLEEPGKPVRVVPRGGLGLMFLPLLDFEDGYGFIYGAQLARPGVAGAHSRLSFPLTWGGDRHAAAQLEKSFDATTGLLGTHGVLTRVETGGSIDQRTNPYFQADDTRDRIWFRGERVIGGSLTAGGTAAWQRVSFGGSTDRFAEFGLDVAFDTRLDPMLARNAVYARASVSHLNFENAGAVNRTALDGRGYIGLPGQSILVLRAQREDSDVPLPPYLKSLLGGMANLRGFRAGSAVGDTLVAGSIEVRTPLTSPLKVGKFGVNAFVDVATVYDNGQRLSDQPFHEGAGGGVWLSAAFFRMTFVVAHGVGEGTRAHFGTTLSF